MEVTAGLSETKELPVDFNEKLLHRLVDYTTVYSDGRAVFTFRNGVEVSTEILSRKRPGHRVCARCLQPLLCKLVREKLRVEQGVKVGFVYRISELCAIFYMFLSLLLHDYFADLNIYTVQCYFETEDKEIQLRALGKLLN